MKHNLFSKVQSKLECPPATQDIELNLANRQKCIDIANYGPANPALDNNEYWQRKADQFKTYIDEAKTMRCSNCAAFVVKQKMLDCISIGIDPDEEGEASEIIDIANLGYCELFDFKCAGDRTCDAWILNGPLKDK
ncbi:hypothetical protein EBZ38_04765 [bacterium]|nr:hypothetical protein [bacterium]